MADHLKAQEMLLSEQLCSKLTISEQVSVMRVSLGMSPWVDDSFSVDFQYWDSAVAKYMAQELELEPAGYLDLESTEVLEPSLLHSENPNLQSKMVNEDPCDKSLKDSLQKLKEALEELKASSSQLVNEFKEYREEIEATEQVTDSCDDYVVPLKENTDHLVVNMQQDSDACKVFDEMSNKRNEEPVPCTEILEPNLERSTSDSLIVGGDPSLKSEAEVNPESDFSYLGIGRAMIDDMTHKVVLKGNSPFSLLEFHLMDGMIDDMTHKVVLKGNSPFSLLEFRLMDGSCLPEDTSSDDAHTVMSELMANSFHTIGIRMNNFRKISVSPFENYSAYQLFDKMPMRSAPLFVGNWVVHQHVFDPGISKGCRGKQALGPSENFISCDNWFQELLLPQMCSMKNVKVGSCTLLVGYQILVFDPGGVFCHDWVHYNSTYAAALVCICWVLGGLIFVWDPGGVVQPCLQVLRLS